MRKPNDELQTGNESIEVSVKVNNRIVFYRVATFTNMQGQAARYTLDDGTVMITPRDPDNLKAIAVQILNR